jgi:hypothetical protein
MAEGESRVSMSKDFFWSMFKPVWLKAFTEENIQHAFAKPGIWPITPDEILSRISRPVPKPPPRPIGELKPPKSLKSIRHFRLD